MGQLIIDDIERIPPDGREAIETIIRNTGAAPCYHLDTDIDCLSNALQKVFCCTLDELKSKSKKRDLPYARHIYFYYVRKMYSTLSQQEIGLLLSRSQKSVSYSLAFFERENSRFNSKFRKYVAEVNRVFGNKEKRG
ncbi:MAG: hypothetical protein LBF69_05295 [Prevotellaceae bacterium]|jgi:chromosomal replication initiation ATPase DnaA|nr:hypothetical protein [Prevotellaceae bacterium]